MSVGEIEKMLRALRLSGMRESLDARAIQAEQGKLPFLEAFALLLHDELDRRRTKLVERRVKASGLMDLKTMSDFDWTFNARLPKKTIFELLALKFVTRREDALFLGPPGTGKSHTAKAIGHAAAHAGYRVLYRPAHLLFEELNEAAALKNRRKLVKALSLTDLLIIDDLALRKLPETAGDDTLEIIMNRYEKFSTIITSNRPLEDWPKLFGDAATVSVLLDRVMHHGHLLHFEGRSYRLKGQKRLAKNELEN